jgi:hypothetical protein
MKTKHSTKIITKLNRDSKEGTIKWEINRNKPSSLSGSEFLLDNVYVCSVLDKNLRLYKYQAKHYFDEDTYEWLDHYRLEFIDKWGASEWTFPDDEATYHLYETVRFKTSDVEGFIDKFLSDEEKKDVDNGPMPW